MGSPVLPAYAGMIPGLVTRRGFAVCAPRLRGDDPLAISSVCFVKLMWSVSYLVSGQRRMAVLCSFVADQY